MALRDALVDEAHRAKRKGFEAEPNKRMPHRTHPTKCERTDRLIYVIPPKFSRSTDQPLNQLSKGN